MCSVITSSKDNEKYCLQRQICLNNYVFYVLDRITFKNLEIYVYITYNSSIHIFAIYVYAYIYI